MRKIIEHIGIHSKLKQRGQVVAEFGLLIPILLLFICGLVDVGFLTAKSFTVSSAASDLCRTMQQDPDLLADADACEDYIVAAYPLLDEADTTVTIDVDPIEKTTYDHHIISMDAYGNRSDYARASTVSSQTFTVRVTHDLSFITPLTAFMGAVGGAGVADDYTLAKEYRGTVDLTVAENDW